MDLNPLRLEPGSAETKLYLAHYSDWIEQLAASCLESLMASYLESARPDIVLLDLLRPDQPR